ncbi:hypothetical protein ACA910_010826 [Epithemia clementina (nom. ined.)]
MERRCLDWKPAFILHRRKCFSELSIALVTFVQPAHSLAAADFESDLCKDGSLQAEQAVPGAYEQSCMQLTTRDVPIHIRTADEKFVETRRLSLQQGMAGAGSTGMAVWNSSILLERLLEAVQYNDPYFFSGQDLVVELGCGPGLVSLATFYLGAPRVLATDGNPNVVQLARQNIIHNKVTQATTNATQNHVQAIELPWGSLDAIDYSETASLVLGSDLTYNSGTWRALAETMETILKANGSILYLTLGHAGFNANAELQGFLSVALEMGLVQVFPSDKTWPFPGLVPSQAQLTSTFMENKMTPREKAVVQSTGGVGIVVLQKKRFAKA